MPDTPMRAADGGYTSRKFVLTLVSMGAIVALAVSAAWCPGLAAQIPNAVTGILGALGIYSGVNVATRWTHAKYGVPGQPAELDDQQASTTAPVEPLPEE